jgi:hypothetical protein
MDILTFMQCNIQSINKNKDELQRLLLEKNYAAVFLSETWTQVDLENSNKYTISKYQQFLQSRADNYGGCAIYLRTDLAYLNISIPQLSNFTQAIAVKLACLDLILVSLYIAPQITLQLLDSDLEILFNSLKSYDRILIAEDFNAHHSIWGNDFDDRKGEIVLNYINSNNIVLLNDQSKTFIPLQVNRRQTSIDLTLCSPSIFHKATWNTLDFGIGSHHLLIETTFTSNQPISNQKFIYNQKQIETEVSRTTSSDFN